MLKACVQLLNKTVKNTNSFSLLLITTTNVPKCITERHFTSTTGILHRLELYSPNLQVVRNYAKSKDKKKEKGCYFRLGSIVFNAVLPNSFLVGKVKIEINEAQLAEIVNIDSLKNQMEKAVTTLKADYIKHLSLRSTAGSIESIPVSLDGKDHTLQELAQIVRKNPKTIVINMAVFPQAIPAALKAIEKSGMNLNPQQDGTTLYIPVPPVTKEHRESLAKNAKTLFTKCKDNIRDVQNKLTKSLKKKEGISVDTVRNAEQQVVAVADKYISEAEKIMESKQHELIGKD